MNYRFEIATVSNDLGQYDELLTSFADAGFDESHCRFVLYDNSQSNRYDPYDVLRKLPESGDEPYLILCHQDIRLDLGATYQDLCNRIEELNRLDPQWRVAGNAGGDWWGRSLLHLNDPNGNWRTSGFPASVQALDENFLIFRRTAEQPVAPDTSGFHFYGTDACLTALSRGHKAYVIDFLLTHLSGGDVHSDSFAAAKREFESAWGRRVLWATIHTPCTKLTMANNGMIRRLLHWRPFEKLVRIVENPVFKRTQQPPAGPSTVN